MTIANLVLPSERQSQHAPQRLSRLAGIVPTSPLIYHIPRRPAHMTDPVVGHIHVLLQAEPPPVTISVSVISSVPDCHVNDIPPKAYTTPSIGHSEQASVNAQGSRMRHSLRPCHTCPPLNPPPRFAEWKTYTSLEEAKEILPRTLV